MSGFDDRKKASEGKFAHEEEVKFRIASRRRKLLGLWVAEMLGMNDEESLKYAGDIIGYGIDDNTPGAVIKKIMNDAEKRGVKLPEAKIRSKNTEFEILASRQILEEKK